MSTTSARVQASLALLQQYVEEIVVPFGICPWAGAAWRGGETRAHVSEASAFAVTELLAFAETLEEVPAEAPIVKIGFFVMPAFPGRPAAWERHAEEARRALRGRAGATRGWHLAAFHPDFPADFASPGQLVSALRRSPDPLLQLVATEGLAALAGEPSRTTPPRDVSAEVAARNFTFAQAHRAELEAAFARLRLKSEEARASARAEAGEVRSR